MRLTSRVGTHMKNVGPHLDPSNGLCNGTRLVCKDFKSNVIHAEITMGQHAGKQVVTTHTQPYRYCSLWAQGGPHGFKKRLLG